ncbi:AAA family ATPase, partial [Bacillus sp. JJ1764]
VYLGASPRGSIALMKAAQAYAFMFGREYVLPDDVQYLASFVLSHRIILKSEAKFEGFSAEEVVSNVVGRVPVPVQRLVK